MWQKVSVGVVLLAGIVGTVFIVINTTFGKSGAKRAPDDQAVVLPKAAPFDGKRAMKYLESICAIGPRQSATAGMREQIKLVVKHFEDLGVKVERQTFQGKQVSRQNAVEMTNLVFRFWPEREKRVMLCSHYDTRPIADQEPDERDWRKPFVSANDGGSGVALFMEMANHIKGLKIDVGVDLVLFDGEEYVFDRGDDYFFGSKHFAREYKANKGKMHYEAAILLDMIAGKGAKLPMEEHSWLYARPLCKEIWDIARKLNCNMFKDKVGDKVYDDHLALQEAGIQAIDLIDFSYAHWHRLSDVPANCSAESMSEVAKVLSTWMQMVK
jgi:glutaminyl-peptide cyclotransferase